LDPELYSQKAADRQQVKVNLVQPMGLR
jgi:hypothetical protein